MHKPRRMDGRIASHVCFCYSHLEKDEVGGQAAEDPFWGSVESMAKAGSLETGTRYLLMTGVYGRVS